MEEVIEKPSTELTVQDRAALALGSTQTRIDLAAMAAKSAHLVEVKNKAARDEVHGAAMALASARIAISKTSKAARDDATKFSKACIAEEASLIEITAAEEKRLLALRDEWDAVVAAEKAIKEAAERERITAIHKRIATIREFVALAASCRTAARVDDLLTKLHATSLADFEEFVDEAAAAHLDAMERVIAIFDEKIAQEAEQARIKAEQAEAAAKLAAERTAFESSQALALAEANRVAKQHVAQVAADKAKADAEATHAAAELAKQRAALEADAKRQSDALAAQHAAQAAEQQRALQAAKEEQDKRDVEASVERKKFAQEKAAFEAQVAETKRVAAQLEQDRLYALREIETPVDPEIMPELAPANAEQAQAAIETEATTEPSDADLMWIAICAVATEYDWPTEQATARLQAIQWTI